MHIPSHLYFLVVFIYLSGIAMGFYLLPSGQRLTIENHHFIVGKSTISTGPFSSSQTVNVSGSQGWKIPPLGPSPKGPQGPQAWKCPARWIGVVGSIGSDLWPSDQCGGTRSRSRTWDGACFCFFFGGPEDVGILTKWIWHNLKMFQSSQWLLHTINDMCIYIYISYMHESVNGNKRSWSWIRISIIITWFITRRFNTWKSWAYWPGCSKSGDWVGACRRNDLEMERFWIPKLAHYIC